MYNKSGRGKRMDKQLKIMIESETHDRLREKTEANGHTVSWVLRRAIEDYLAGVWQPVKPTKSKGGKAAT